MSDPAVSSGAPADARDELAPLLAALARLALHNGLKLGDLTEMTKVALVEAAYAQEPSPSRAESRVAVRTGVHRKDLRRMREQGLKPRPRRSIAAEVFARWMSDPRYLTARGTPRVLPRQGELSFESLVGGISTDTHSRAVLAELLRLGIVEPARADHLRLVERAFVPTADRAQALRFGVANIADHMAAVHANLEAGGRRFLDQAVYADELSEPSAREFNAQTSQAWSLLFDAMMPRLRALYDDDRRTGRALTHRVRLGAYGYAEPISAERTDQ
jgi:hypothetical protein